MPTLNPVKFISGNVKYKASSQPQVNLLKDIRKAIDRQYKTEQLNEKKYLESTAINKKLTDDRSKAIENYKRYQLQLSNRQRHQQNQEQQQQHQQYQQHQQLQQQNQKLQESLLNSASAATVS